MGRIWDGDEIAQEILHRVREEVMVRRRAGHPPLILAEVRVGGSPLGDHLQGLQKEACRFAGIGYQICTLPLATDQHSIRQALAELNADPRVSGIALQTLTEPYGRILAEALAPAKDVDGVHPLHLGRLITNRNVVRATRGSEIVQLLKHIGVTLVGARVMCIGNLSGLARLLAFLCLHENATISAWGCTSTWAAELVQDADVLVLDTEDRPELHGMALKPGAVVIDARHHRHAWMSRREKWFEVISLLIPMPGGMGPPTIATRLASLVALAQTPDRLQAIHSRE